MIHPSSRPPRGRRASQRRSSHLHVARARAAQEREQWRETRRCLIVATCFWACLTAVLLISLVILSGPIVHGAFEDFLTDHRREENEDVQQQEVQELNTNHIIPDGIENAYGWVAPSSSSGGDGAASSAGIVVLVLLPQGYQFVSTQAVMQLMGNKNEYCRRHGYDMVIVRCERVSEVLPDRCVGATTRSLLDLSPEKYSWAWVVEPDVLVMDMDVRLEDLLVDHGEFQQTRENVLENATPARPLSHEVDIVLSRDCNGLNAGSMFVRLSTSAREHIIPRVQAMTTSRTFDHSVQQAIHHLTQEHAFSKHVYVAPNFLFSSYPDIGRLQTDQVCTGGFYRPGDFVVRFMGCQHRNDCEQWFIPHWEEHEKQMPKDYWRRDNMENAS